MYEHGKKKIGQSTDSLLFKSFFSINYCMAEWATQSSIVNKLPIVGMNWMKKDSTSTHTVPVQALTML